MPLPGQLTIGDALAKAPAGVNKTAIAADLTQLLTDLNTAVSNGGLTANIRDTLFYNMLVSFAEQLAVNLKS
jgi:hypothetical protein